MIVADSKFSGAAPLQVKNRPRIPTPDVTKEVVDRENLLPPGLTNVHHTNQMTHGITLMPHHLPPSAYPSIYPNGDSPLVQVVLSPIQELDGSGSVNNTLHAHQPGTAALAQAVLSPGLGPVLSTSTSPVSVPMTVSQLTSLGLATSVQNSPLLTARNNQQHMGNKTPIFIQAFEPDRGVILTELATSPSGDDEMPFTSRSSDVSTGSDLASNASKDSKQSIMSNATLSVSSRNDETQTDSLVSHVSSPNSMPLPIVDEDRSRKTSLASQNNNNNANSGKRGEVYV